MSDCFSRKLVSRSCVHKLFKIFYYLKYLSFEVFCTSKKVQLWWIGGIFRQEKAKFQPPGIETTLFKANFASLAPCTMINELFFWMKMPNILNFLIVSSLESKCRLSNFWAYTCVNFKAFFANLLYSKNAKKRFFADFLCTKLNHLAGKVLDFYTIIRLIFFKLL
jgi:hypothetical protein